MLNTDVHIDTLRVQAPEEAAQQVRLRLSTKLSGADLRPPGLAPSQVLLVRELEDPEPGRMGLENVGPTLDRTWERAVRDALGDCLRRAVRPTNGRVPPGAEAVLFRDAAEAWACWGREQGAGEPSAAGPWWTQSLEASSDAPSPPTGRSPTVAAVWRARPRLVPAMAAHLAAWDAAVDVLRQMSESEAEDVLRAVCTAFDATPPPTQKGPVDRVDEEETAHRSVPSIPDEQRQTVEGHPDDAESEPPESERPPDEATPEEPSPEESPPEEAGSEELGLEAGPLRRPVPPWSPFVEEVGDARLVNALAQESPAHRQLLGVVLTLRDRPVTVRSHSFQSAWRAWRHAIERPAEPPDRSSEDEEAIPDRRGGEAGQISAPDAWEHSSLEETSPEDERALNGDRRTGGSETTPAGEEEEPSWEDAYTATELGGVFYLVNVLDALDLPASAETPPVDEHVGAWAVLEALARALLGPDDDALRPNDPLWRVLATLDGRRPDTPAGRALDDAEDLPEAFRMPSAWLESPPVNAPVDGQWAVTDGRLQMWADLGCVADLEAGDDPGAQAEAEWDRFPNTGLLQRAESSDAMPLAPEPADCAPALARWAACTAPYVRYRLAAALGVDDRTAGWTADLFRAAGKLYTTDTHVDLVLPLDAARIDARVAGLDRSPGWWPAGGRVVRFHFREADA